MHQRQIEQTSTFQRLCKILTDMVLEDSRISNVPIVAVSGPQGSGKSTLSQYVAKFTNAAYLSIDDFYNTKNERILLAKDIHPLLEVRGPPGTHDLPMLNEIVSALRHNSDRKSVRIPRFDKLADDRLPIEDWATFSGSPSAIIIEGWCIGATPLDRIALHQPINELEANQDADNVWRDYWNNALSGEYTELNYLARSLLFIAPPSFEAVVLWKLKQHASLLNIPYNHLLDADIKYVQQFVQFFQHLTVHMANGGVRATRRVGLDEERKIASIL